MLLNVQINWLSNEHHTSQEIEFRLLVCACIHGFMNDEDLGAASSTRRVKTRGQKTLTDGEVGSVRLTTAGVSEMRCL